MAAARKDKVYHKLADMVCFAMDRFEKAQTDDEKNKAMIEIIACKKFYLQSVVPGADENSRVFKSLKIMMDRAHDLLLS
jgi:hypothetical protein